ncbi:MAG TPA: carbohydrate ABC transporter permease, partial [Aggregatilineales bacterium]|nr:carbohydrate ABC transporter permease [Aggregatilineales bacterium]
MNNARLIRGLGLGIPSAFFIVFTLFPIYWLINSSLKTQNELFRFPPLYLPQQPTLDNYVNAITGTRLGSLYTSSIIVALLTCVILMVLIIFAGYGMARFRFRGKNILLIIFLMAQMLPHVVLLVPFFTFYRAFGLNNTYFSLIFTYVFTWLPFSVLMMRSYYYNIPREIDEAALVDGCTRTGALFRVII